MELEHRKQVLLRAVVDVHVRTAEPVGSKAIVESYQLPVRAATVRNELAEMTDLGFLIQPHTSAGRVPSDLGYRFYVDRLMEPPPQGEELRRGAAVLRQHAYDELDEILRQTCRLLSSLTRYASVASIPELDSQVVNQIHLTSLAPHRVLAVVIPHAGDVLHRFIETKEPVAPTTLTRLGGLLNEKLSTLTFEQVRLLPPTAFEETPGELRALCGTVLEALQDLLAPDPGAEVVVEGTSQIMRQPEFQDVARLETLLSALEQRQELLRVLRDSVSHRLTAIRIGGENPQAGMRECSLVAARYSLGQGAYGTIGVIGPTRMDYARAVSAVRAMAGCLSDLFGRLGIA